MRRRARGGAGSEGAAADRLHSAAIHLLRRLRRQDEATGLTPSRASALSVVVFGGPLSMKSLAEAEQVSAPTMTRLVAGLERDGFVTRAANPADGRSVRIKATANGVRTLQEGRRRRVEDLERRMAGLAPREIGLLSKAAELMEAMSREAAGGRKARADKRRPGGGKKKPVRDS